MSQTAAAGKGWPLWFAACRDALLAILEASVRAFIRVLKAAVCVADLIALAFAAPIYALLRRNLPSLHLGGVVESQLKAIGSSAS
jgi:hypothetical protein